MLERKMSPTLIVEENGFYSCDGVGHCGGTHYRGRKETITCFRCESCKSYQKNGLKIIKPERTLTEWFSD